MTMAIPTDIWIDPRRDVEAPYATSGIDTNGDGFANLYFHGLDRNRDGLPDALQSQATVLPTNASVRLDSMPSQNYLQDSMRQYAEQQQAQAHQQAESTGWFDWMFGSSETFTQGGSSSSTAQAPIGVGVGDRVQARHGHGVSLGRVLAIDGAGDCQIQFDDGTARVWHMSQIQLVEKAYVQQPGNYYQEQVLNYHMQQQRQATEQELQQELMRQEQLREQQIQQTRPQGGWNDNLARELMRTEEDRNAILRDERMYRETMEVERMKQENLRREQLQQERLQQTQLQLNDTFQAGMRQEVRGQQNLYEDQLQVEKQRQEHLRREQLDQERLQQEQRQLNQLRRDDVLQEGLAQKIVHHDQLELERQRQEHLRQEQLQQERVKQEQLKLNQIRHEDVSLVQLAQENIHQGILQQERRQLDHMRQDDMRQEQLGQDLLHKEQAELERSRQEHLRREQMQHERLQQDRIQVNQLRQENVAQEQSGQDRLYQEQLELERQKQELLRHEQLQQERLRQEQNHLKQMKEEDARQEQFRQTQLEEERQRDRYEKMQRDQEKAQQEQLREEQCRHQQELRQEQLRQEQLAHAMQQPARTSVTHTERIDVNADGSLDVTVVDRIRSDNANVDQRFPVGTDVHYLSSKQGWIPAVVHSYHKDTMYNLNIRGQAEPAKIRLPPGTNVQYYSASKGQWIPAVVQGYDERVYRLDIHGHADPAKVRLAPQVPVAVAGVDTNGDGNANFNYVGVDRNRDGIPDALQQAPEAQRIRQKADEDMSYSRHVLASQQSQANGGLVQAGAFGIDATCHVGKRKFLNADVVKGGSARFDAQSAATPQTNGRYIQGAEIKPAKSIERAVSPSPIHAERFPAPVGYSLPVTSVVPQVVSPAQVYGDVSAPVSLSQPVSIRRDLSPAPVVREVARIPRDVSPAPMRVSRNVVTITDRPKVGQPISAAAAYVPLQAPLSPRLLKPVA